MRPGPFSPRPRRQLRLAHPDRSRPGGGGPLRDVERRAGAAGPGERTPGGLRHRRRGRRAAQGRDRRLLRRRGRPPRPRRRHRRHGATVLGRGPVPARRRPAVHLQRRRPEGTRLGPTRGRAPPRRRRPSPAAARARPCRRGPSLIRRALPHDRHDRQRGHLDDGKGWPDHLRQRRARRSGSATGPTSSSAATGRTERGPGRRDGGERAARTRSGSHGPLRRPPPEEERRDRLAPCQCLADLRRRR